MGATLQDRGKKTELVWVRKPHVGATRGGRSLRFRKGAGGLRRARRGEPGPQTLSSSLGGWGNPSVRPPRPPSPPFPSRAWWRGVGGGIARGARGETRQVRSPPSRRRRLPPSSPPALGGATAGPAPRAPARGPRRPAWPGGLGAPPPPSLSSLARVVVGLWPICAPSCDFSQMTPLPTRISVSPFPSWSPHLRCRDFFSTDTFNPFMPPSGL